MKLKREFKDFHEIIKVVYSNELVTKKNMFENEIRENLPGILKDNGINIKKLDIEFFIQGSCATHTLVDTGGDVDLDLAVILPIDKEENEDCRKIKGYVKDSISIHNRTIDIKKPCVTVDYQSDCLHIDLPVYALYNGEYYLALGKKTGDYEWQKCDPKGLNEHFRGYLSYNEQLRRIVRYLKKWKSVCFNEGNGMPPSVAMTLLACKHFEEKKENDECDDLAALYNVVKKIKESIPYGDAPIFKVNLPTYPHSDTMHKINSNESYRKTFKGKVENLLTQLTNAINASDDYTAGIYMQKVFGDVFPLPKKQVDASENKYRGTGHFG